MHLSRKILSGLNTDDIDIPADDYFQLPEKVLQFGTGVLLRALPDHYIDQANKKNIFNGRIVMVKSTDGPGMEEFEQQDGLYTVCLRGYQEGKRIETNSINASVSRILSAKKNWGTVLQCASNPDLQIIISNTTEVGLVLVQDDIAAKPPVSFPGKLLAFLYQRFQVFKGDPAKGLVIIPTELIQDNADKLLEILLELSKQNGLSSDFVSWLKDANSFCNSLVDRIVPGKLSEGRQKEMEQTFGYEDPLMIMGEPYGLWAIESGDPKVKEVLSFDQVNPGVRVMPDISVPRELKLRLLNGSLTFSCGLAFLSGFTRVKESMDDPSFAAYMENLMRKEIVPVISGNEITVDLAMAFVRTVLDRYRNLYIEHRWLGITLQYSSKMFMRNAVLLNQYMTRFHKPPEGMALGFAAYLQFMRPVETGPGEKFAGSFNGVAYPINDDQAGYFAELWKQNATGELVKKVLSNTALWKTDLSAYPGFADTVTRYLDAFEKEGVRHTLQQAAQPLLHS
jgi:tagaturonate reductase